MILVLLGTQDRQFRRLLEGIQKAIDEGKIEDEIIVQAGHTKFETKDMKIFDLIPKEKYEDIIAKADIVITHGGVGSIFDSLKKNKKVIAAARLKKYGEHADDHQLQIIKAFVSKKYIIELKDFNKVGETIKKVKKFKPKKFISNSKHFEEKVEEYINSI